MKDRNIIIVGQQAWDTDLGSNCKNIAAEFAKSNRVLYINPPLDRITRFRNHALPEIAKRIRIISGRQSGLEQLSPNLFTLYPDCMIESINWLPKGKIYDLFNLQNNKTFFRAISSVIDELGFSDPILFNDGDIFRSQYLKDMIKPATSIYYSRDNMIATAYYKKHGTRLEPMLIAKNDLCVANSEFLRDYCANYNPNAYYVGQGCEFSDFDNYLSQKADQPRGKTTTPVIGYIGALTAARLDIKLIASIARERPEWKIILVGPEDAEFTNSELHGIANVTFIGPRPQHELPEWIDGFDVCINPQLVNPLTIGNYPRKIDEYLAMGKPVVATATPSMSAFSAHVSLAKDVQDYILQIERILSTDQQQYISDRKEFARSHSWAQSVKLMYQAIEKFEQIK